MDDLYQEIILDHVNNPRNFGTMEHPTIVLKDANASCGDMVEMQFLIENGVVKDVQWRGIGCAISTASASMLSEMIKGKTVKKAKAITEQDLMNSMGLKTILPTRQKCLMLSLKILEKL